jgi:hypothetical protein
MHKLIVIALTMAATISLSAPVFALCYPNGYCAPYCTTVWNGYGWVYQCY